MSGAGLQSVVMIGLVATLLVAAVSDAVRYVIPNFVVLALVALFLIAAPFAADPLSWFGHLGAGAAVFVAGCVLFHYGLMGGGDVKLWAACALWMGIDLLPAHLFYVTVIGALLGIVLFSVRAALARAAVFGPARARVALPRLLREGEAVPYGVAIAAGSMLLVGQIAVKFS